MCCMWYAQCCGPATWACELETVRGARRGWGGVGFGAKKDRRNQTIVFGTGSCGLYDSYTFVLSLPTVTTTTSTSSSLSSSSSSSTTTTLTATCNWTSPQKHVPWRSIATSMPNYAIIVSNVTSDWGAYTLLTNIPTYISEVLKFNIASVGPWTTLPFTQESLICLFSPSSRRVPDFVTWISLKAFHLSVIVDNRQFHDVLFFFLVGRWNTGRLFPLVGFWHFLFIFSSFFWERGGGGGGGRLFLDYWI